MRRTNLDRTRAGRLMGWAMMVTLACGCAEGKLSENAGAGDAASDLQQDRRVIPDTAEDPVADPTPDPRIDPIPEVDEPELVGECEPFSVACTEDGYGIQRCSAEGALFEPFECGFDKVCEQGAGEVQCVDCVPDVSCREEEPACEPGVAFCLDFQTAAQCTEEGQVGVTSGCGTGRCFGGGCNSTGNETGQVCADDTGCRGRRCLCGANDTANLGSDLCQGNLTSGYCTTGGCDQNGCHPDNEVCADFELSGAFGGGQNCVLVESCGSRLAACGGGYRGDGHVCRELPSSDADGSRSWEIGCWAPPSSDPDLPCAGDNCAAPIGAACAANSDCLGGLCLNAGGVSYCAAPCDESRGCPSYAACVRPDDTSDTHICLAKAQEDDCPRLISNFNIVARSFAELGGVTTASVCYVRED